MRIYREKAKRLRAFERGYLAGIIDGDGSLILQKRKAEGNRAGITYEALLSIGNTSEILIQYLMKILGVGHFCKIKSKKPHYKDIYSFQVSGITLKSILSQVVLVIKEEQRKLLLEAQDLIEQHHRGYTPYFKRLSEIAAKIHKLNQRGVS